MVPKKLDQLTMKELEKTELYRAGGEDPESIVFDVCDLQVALKATMDDNSKRPKVILLNMCANLKAELEGELLDTVEKLDDPVSKVEEKIQVFQGQLNELNATDGDRPRNSVDNNPYQVASFRREVVLAQLPKAVRVSCQEQRVDEISKATNFTVVLHEDASEILKTTSSIELGNYQAGGALWTSAHGACLPATA